MTRSLAIILPILLAASFAKAEATPVGVLLDVAGPIGPATSDYVRRGIEDAEQRQAVLVVLRIDTPGGLDTSMREIIQEITTSSVPIVSYVAPSGARAASAGTYILYASHVAAMAPGTNLGAATPVRVGAPGPFLPFPRNGDEGSEDSPPGEPDEEAGEPSEPQAPPPTLEKKMISDAVAYIRSLAEMRGRNADWAEKAVREAASLTARQALTEGVIDLVAADLEDLLAQLEGRTVSVLGAERKLSPAPASLVKVEPDWRTQLLGILTNPNVAYVLMLVGVYGLVLEFYNPGMLFPGVTGAICLLLALYAFHVLPINYAGLALLLLGVALMVGEAFAPSFGALGIGGAAAFVIGSVMLLEMDVPGYGVSWLLTGSIALVSSGFFLVTMMLLMRARQRAVVSGPEEMIGAEGRVVEWTGGEGRVRVHGELWRARADAALEPGAAIRVADLEGLTLVVEPEDKRRSLEP